MFCVTCGRRKGEGGVGSSSWVGSPRESFCCESVEAEGAGREDEVEGCGAIGSWTGVGGGGLRFSERPGIEVEVLERELVFVEVS